MGVSLSAHVRQRMAVAAVVVLMAASAPASAEGKAVIAVARDVLAQSAQPIAQRLRVQACRLLLSSGAVWPADKAVGSWT